MRLVGIDIGGTFTDLALYDSEDGRTQVHKVHSTPDDPGRALVTGVLELCERAGIEPASLDGVLHGTTVATNAVLEHHGARTGHGHDPGRARRAAHRAPPAPRAVLGAARHPLADRAVRRAPVAPDGAGASRAADRRGHRAARRGGRARGRARARRGRGRGDRGVLPVLLPRPGARAARGGDPARGAAGLLRLHLGRHHAAVPRVRALHDGGDERVRRPGHRRVPRAPRGGAAPRRGGRRDPRHALQRRRRERRRGRGAPGDPHAVRARRRACSARAGRARSSGGGAS